MSVSHIHDDDCCMFSAADFSFSLGNEFKSSKLQEDRQVKSYKVMVNHSPIFLQVPYNMANKITVSKAPGSSGAK